MPSNNMEQMNSEESTKNRNQQPFMIIKAIAFIIIFISSIIVINNQIVDVEETEDTEEPVWSDNCNVQGIELLGDLVTYNQVTGETSEEYALDQTASQDIVYYIEQAEQNEDIKAIILEIDSLGGYPVAGEEVTRALKLATKPTVALIRGAGDSAAYMAATGADRIFASKFSDVGGIGVTMSYLETAKQNEKDGIVYQSLTSGKFKDAGDPDKTLSAEERALLMRDINLLHDDFVELVATNRSLDVEKVKDLADGSTMLGEMALENGLIDEIGGYPEVKEYLKQQINEDIEVCW